MKTNRHAKILELIRTQNVETQEQLADLLMEAGYPVTQATVSRDIRELHLTKVTYARGKQKYGVVTQGNGHMTGKYITVLREGFLSMDMAQNILVIRTVPGMAMAVAAALDHLDCHEIVGSIAGDDTILCAVRTVEDTVQLMERLKRTMEE